MLNGRILKRLGCWCVMAADVAQARHRLTEHEFELALVDVNMPGASGLDLMRYIADRHPTTAVLMVTAVHDPLIADSALELGAYGYLVKPFECNELLINVSSALRRRKLELQNREHRERLEQLALGGCVLFHDTLERLKQAGDRISEADEKHILQAARLAEFRDQNPGEHIEKMSTICAAMARRLGRAPETCERIRLASMLHDLGKIAIPDSILFKCGRLTQYELEVMRRHANFGHHLLMGTQSKLLELAATIAWTHHERFDGSGYPRGLAADAIPLEGRIAAIADVFDSLTNQTPYKPGYPLDKALDIMVDGRGKHFDPILLDLFIEAIEPAIALDESAA